MKLSKDAEVPTGRVLTERRFISVAFCDVLQCLRLQLCVKLAGNNNPVCSLCLIQL